MHIILGSREAHVYTAKSRAGKRQCGDLHIQSTRMRCCKAPGTTAILFCEVVARRVHVQHVRQVQKSETNRRAKGGQRKEGQWVGRGERGVSGVCDLGGLGA